MVSMSAVLTLVARPVRSARVRESSVILRSVFTAKVSSVMPRYISTITGSTIANSTAATPSRDGTKR